MIPLASVVLKALTPFMSASDGAPEEVVAPFKDTIEPSVTLTSNPAGLPVIVAPPSLTVLPLSARTPVVPLFKICVLELLETVLAIDRIP